MILLIDAYNLIRFLQPELYQVEEAHIVWYLTRLRAYYKEKCSDVTEVTVVFDGGLFFHKTREMFASGVVVVYAGSGMKADDVLVYYAQKLRNTSVLITNDRALQKRALEFQTTSLCVSEFWKLVESVRSRKKHCEEEVRLRAGLSIEKFSPQESDADEMPESCEDLDALMVAASATETRDALKNDVESVKKRAAAFTAGKKEKFSLAMRKKLG